MFNAESFIERAAKSVTEQTYKNISWVICDDVSTDNSVNKVLSLMDDYVPANIFGLKGYHGFINGIDTTIICNDVNSKQGKCRNICIQAASYADLYKNLDTDDWMEPTCIEEHVNAWLNNPEEISVIYSDYNVYNEDTGISITEYKESFQMEKLLQHCQISSGSMFPRWALQKTGLYFENEFNKEDYGLHLRLSHVGVPIHLAKPLWNYSVHNNNSTHPRNQSQMEQGFRNMVENYKLWRNQQGL